MSLRVDPKLGVSHASGVGTSATREVEVRRTPVSKTELRGAIKRALTRVEGKEPSDKFVDVLTAQASLETASGDRMYNYNFGGIKGHSPAGNTAVARTKEVINGREIEIRDGFRAYNSIDEGAVDYVKVMKSRFSGALSPAERGDVAGFAHALKSAGYYTAAESDYAKGLASQMGIKLSPEKTAAHRDSAYASLDATTFGTRDLGSLSTTGLARVEDSLDASRFGSLLSPSMTSGHHRASDDEDDS